MQSFDHKSIGDFLPTRSLTKSQRYARLRLI